MKLLTLKLSLIAGLSVSGGSFCQTSLQDESDLNSDQFPTNHTTIKNNFTEDEKAFDFLSSNKTYGDGIYTINLIATAATPYSSSVTLNYGSKGCIYGSGYFDLPLQLPDGHEIFGVRYAFEDSSSDSTEVHLASVDFTGNFVIENTLSSTGDTGYGFIVDYLSPRVVIDNANYKYMIRFYSPTSTTDQKMCAVQLVMDSAP